MSSQMPGKSGSGSATADTAPLRAASGAETDAARAMTTGSDRQEEPWAGEDDRTDADGSSSAGDPASRVGGRDAGSVRLVVGVLTGGRNRARRDAVRQTWGADAR